MRDRPTHQCKICGALWIYYPKTTDWEGSWSLYSLSCSQCCDVAAMGEQIVDLNNIVPTELKELYDKEIIDWSTW